MTLPIQLISVDDNCQSRLIKDKNESAWPSLCFKLYKNLIVMHSTGWKKFAAILHHQNSFSVLEANPYEAIQTANTIFKDFWPLPIGKGFSYSKVVETAFIDFLKNIPYCILPSFSLWVRIKEQAIPLWVFATVHLIRKRK